MTVTTVYHIKVINLNYSFPNKSVWKQDVIEKPPEIGTSSVDCKGPVSKTSFELEKDHLCGLVVRVPGYRMEMYCVSCEVRTEFIYVM
jgi:hypothetical protein